MLLIQLFDWERVSAPRIVAECLIPYKKFENKGSQQWFQLEKDGVNKGEFEMEILYQTKKRKYIMGTHPLVVYSGYDYEPKQAETKGLRDAEGLLIEDGVKDIPLAVNDACLLRRAEDYPWPDWSWIIPLQYATQIEVEDYFAEKGGTPQNLLYLETPALACGGFAPTTYLQPDYVAQAKQYLESNPDSLTDALNILVGKLPPVVPASCPLIMLALYDYTPGPADDAGPVLDAANQPLEAGFKDIPLEAGNGYLLLRRDDYPWPEWVSVLPVQKLEADDMETYYKAVEGPREALFYLEDTSKTCGGFAPTNYFSPENLAAAKADLEKDPGKAEEAIAFMVKK